MFYPDADEQCRSLARSLLSASDVARAKWIGGIVPHAGWICSGAIAGEVIGTIARETTPDVVVIFGAVHTPIPVDRAVLASFSAWQVPGGTSQVSGDLASQVQSSSPLFAMDDRFHLREHAVEVELPLVQQAWPDAQLLPIEVPLTEDAIAIGERTARAVETSGLKPVYLASSDMTHYGPSYRFTPFGVGIEALGLAKENDRRLLEIVSRFAPEQVVPEVRNRANACGGGAIAAMLAACRLHGAQQVNVLRHANSYETLARVHPQTPDNAVGYAGVVVG